MSSAGATTSGTIRSYFTSPRRTSSVAITVGFLEEVGRNGRLPPCSWRARLAATMINRYVLCSGSSGMEQWALLRGASDIVYLFFFINQLERFQNRLDLVF